MWHAPDLRRRAFWTMALGVLLLHGLAVQWLMRAAPLRPGNAASATWATRTLVPATPATPAAPPVPARPGPAASLAPAASPVSAASPAPARVDVLLQPTRPPAAPPLRVASATTVAAPAPLPMRWLPAQTLHFQVQGQSQGQAYESQGVWTWTQDGAHYQAQAQWGTARAGLHQQSSVGDVTPTGLAPLRFGDKLHSELAAHFRRDTGWVSFSAKTPSVPLQSGMQDRLSLVFQLAAIWAARPQAYPSGSVLEWPTVGARGAETWRLRVLPEQELALSSGKVHAVPLRREVSGEYEQQFELWLAPGLGYLPVRLRVTQPNGDYVDQTWVASD